MNTPLSPALMRWRRPGAVVLLLVLPLLPALVQIGRATRSVIPVDLSDLAFPFGLHLGLCAILVAITSRVRSILPILLPAALLGPFEAFYIAEFGIPSGSHVYGVIADTFGDEAISWFGPWLWPVIITAIALAMLLSWAVRECWHADWRWHGRSRGMMLIGASTLGLVIVGGNMYLDNKYKIHFLPEHNHFRHGLTQAPEMIQAQIENSYPWGMPFRMWRFGEHLQALKDHQKDIANFTFGVKRTVTTPPGREVYVLIIGETARANRWGLYGAKRNTTPKLSARTDLTVFTDFISPSAATRESIYLMMTRRPPEAMLEPTPEPSVVTAFNQAGFQTYWLSAQGRAGVHDTPVSVIAREAKEVQFVSGSDYRGHGALDGELLPHLQRVLGKQEQRQFIVVHTLGSHLNYAHRYPAEFEKFRPALPPSDKPDQWSESRKDEMINAYDNTVLYTDTVINDIIEMVKAQGAVATVLFVGDHGETLFDGTCGKSGHGFATEVNFRVPMFVWTSLSWQAWRPDTAALLKERTTMPFSGLSMFPTLTGLAGLSIPAPVAHPDIGGKPLSKATRLVTHFGNFDTNIANGSCDTQIAPAQKGH